MRNVTVIPASINKFTDTPLVSKEKRKVAAYARVSTDHDEQLTSYEAQLSYYTEFIKSHSDWEFVRTKNIGATPGCKRHTHSIS